VTSSRSAKSSRETRSPRRRASPYAVRSYQTPSIGSPSAGTDARRGLVGRTTEGTAGVLVQYVEEPGAPTRRRRVGRATQQARVDALSNQTGGERSGAMRSGIYGSARGSAGNRPRRGSALDRPGRDLHEPTGWGPAIRSAHIMKDGKRRRDLARESWPGNRRSGRSGATTPVGRRLPPGPLSLHPEPSANALGRGPPGRSATAARSPAESRRPGPIVSGSGPSGWRPSARLGPPPAASSRVSRRARPG